MKGKIAENLRELEKLGVVSAADNYQHIVNAIAQVRTVHWYAIVQVPTCTQVHIAHRYV